MHFRKDTGPATEIVAKPGAVPLDLYGEETIIKSNCLDYIDSDDFVKKIDRVFLGERDGHLSLLYPTKTGQT